ncbi:YcnI family protein [Actinokineospora sp. HUAS TT18]|uniref:YcnI family protein n=1 Tax=Actinokineospora sp. HUAS TT18 TaxID=3447451 RepID=UPI003F522E6C
MSRLIFRGLFVVAVAAVAMVLGGYTAFAHVTVSADNPVPGKYTKATFRVPNERAVPTVKLEVSFPPDQPFGRAAVAPVPGWTATVKTHKLDVPVTSHHGETMTEAVESITWEGGEIKPGEFVEFPVSLGPLPTENLVFKSLQTYGDGEIVRWIDTPQAGTEADHPAPVLSLAPVATATSSSGVDGLARVLGLVGAVTAFGALAACVAVLPAARRKVRTVAPPAVGARPRVREKTKV